MGSVLEGTFLENHPQAQRAEEVSRGSGGLGKRSGHLGRQSLSFCIFPSASPSGSKEVQAFLFSSLEEEPKGLESEFFRIQITE